MSSAVLTARATWNRGALLVAGATLVWSSAGLLARWVHTDPVSYTHLTLPTN